MIIRRKLAGGRSGVPTARSPQRVSVTGAGENVSDGEGVGVMFLLMRYQIVIATSYLAAYDFDSARKILLHSNYDGTDLEEFARVPLRVVLRQRSRDRMRRGPSHHSQRPRVVSTVVHR